MRTVLRRGILALAVVLPSGFASAEKATFCSRDAMTEVVVFESEPGSYMLGYCDVQAGLPNAHPRAISRAELVQLYVNAREKYRDGTSSLFETMGVQKSKLSPLNLDSEISGDAMVFLRSEDKGTLLDLAERFRTLKGTTKPVKLVEDSKLRGQLNEELMTGWFASFQAACRDSGGSWVEKRNIVVAAAMALEADTELDRAQKAEGNVVCKCGTLAFSNPIDYRCQLKEKIANQSVFRPRSEDSPIKAGRASRIAK